MTSTSNTPSTLHRMIFYSMILNPKPIKRSKLSIRSPSTLAHEPPAPAWSPVYGPPLTTVAQQMGLAPGVIAGAGNSPHADLVAFFQGPSQHCPLHNIPWRQGGFFPRRGRCDNCQDEAADSIGQLAFPVCVKCMRNSRTPSTPRRLSSSGCRCPQRQNCRLMPPGGRGYVDKFKVF